MSIDLAEGTEVAGRYRLSRLIGEGGMGTVWAAADLQSGEVVALKFVKDCKASVKLGRRLLREAKAACAVRHPNVVEVHDIIELADGSPVMVMELLEGESLATKLEREGEIPLPALIDIMVPVVSAVGTAHALGVVHRDLKPENVFLSKSSDGKVSVKILDFGIAKLAPSEYEASHSTELTRTGSVLGTPCYMAPEQVFGEKDTDHRADIWALGMILYEALSGILPTRAENMGQVMKIITTRAIWPLSQAAPDLPRDLTQLVDRMLNRDRAERPQDLREVAALLARFTSVESPEFDEPSAPPSSSSAFDSAPSSRLALRLDSRADPNADTAADEPLLVIDEAAASASVETTASGRAPHGESVEASVTSRPNGVRPPVLRTAPLVLAVLGVLGAGWWLWPRGAPEVPEVEEPQPISVSDAELQSSQKDDDQVVAASDVSEREIRSGSREPTEDLSARAERSGPSDNEPSRPVGEKRRAPRAVPPRGAAATSTAEPTPPPQLASTVQTQPAAAASAEPPESLGGVVDQPPF